MPPSSYAFIDCSEPGSIRNARTKARIRKHAMKDIGISRRRPRTWHVELELRPQPAEEATRPGSDEGLSGAETSAYHVLTRNRQHHLPRSNSMPMRSLGSEPFDASPYYLWYSSEFPNNFTFSPCASRVVSAAIHDEILLSCLLSSAASRVQYVHGAALAHVRKQEVYCTHRGLQLLQVSLNGSHVRATLPSERLIACVLYLGAGAIYREDFETAQKHIDAAVKLTETIGGTKCIHDQLTLVRLVSLDDTLSCAALKPCSLRCTYDPGPLTHDCPLGQPPHGALPDSFEFADKRSIPIALRAAFLEIVECRRHKNALGQLKSTVSSEALEVRQWVTMRGLAIRNRLLEFTSTDTKARVLRLALIVWTLLPPCDPRQTRTARTLAQSMVTELSRIKDSSWRGLEKIRLWCLLIGFYSAQELSETRSWYAEEIRKRVRCDRSLIGLRRGTSLNEELIAFQERFGFREPTLSHLTEDIVKHLRFWDDFEKD
ncbi:uncharacterized protein LTR77_009615 [Saxophila tyrrhenica]|uniref:Uncharacterized protein n=1 Tax=Saxophila tyrrhenica TaxID=1690608 RepID=A0AAV9P287_9PEZI|nr:hypothetical protein LTR77_009615 [Saxophila tyrrhenica]